MTYSEAERYILDIPKFTKKNDLGQTKKFLEYLGDPQKGMKIIHVAGTNGKGSVYRQHASLRGQKNRTFHITSSGKAQRKDYCQREEYRRQDFLQGIY